MSDEIYKLMKSNLKKINAQYDPMYYMLNPLKEYFESGEASRDFDDILEDLESYVCGSENIQLALDLGGLFPGLGEPFDVGSIVLNLKCGRLIDAFLSALAIVPVIGIGATVFKYVNKSSGAIQKLVHVREKILNHSSRLFLSNTNPEILAKEISDSMQNVSEVLEKIKNRFSNDSKISEGCELIKKEIDNTISELKKMTERIVSGIESGLKSGDDLLSSRNFDDVPTVESKKIIKDSFEVYLKSSPAFKSKLKDILKETFFRASERVIDDNYSKVFKSMSASTNKEFSADILGRFSKYFSEKISKASLIFDESFSLVGVRSARVVFEENTYNDKNYIEYILKTHNKNDAVEKIFKDLYELKNIRFSLPIITYKFHDAITKSKLDDISQELYHILVEEIDHAFQSAFNRFSYSYSAVYKNSQVAKQISSLTSEATFGEFSKGVLENDKIKGKIANQLDINDQLNYYLNPLEMKAAFYKTRLMLKETFPDIPADVAIYNLISNKDLLERLISLRKIYMDENTKDLFKILRIVNEESPEAVRNMLKRL